MFYAWLFVYKKTMKKDKKLFVIWKKKEYNEEWKNHLICLHKRYI